jgi:uncharacterized cupin superfamily protein
MSETPIAVVAADVVVSVRPGGYPADLLAKIAGRDKRRLGELFGLTRYGVNLTTLPPGAASALRHAHKAQDEFVYVLEGEPTLVTDAGETPLRPGMCAGFRAGTGDAHCLVNRSSRTVAYLEIGDRTKPDEVSYPDDDLHGRHEADGVWRFYRKDGTPL